MAGRKTSRNIHATHGQRHDFWQDVKNPIYKEAEERFYRWLLDNGKHVQDDRPENTWHDFTIGHAWTLDVKCDTQAGATGNVAWEQGMSFPDGRIRDGWGMHPGLSYVVYVLLPPEDRRDGPWPFVLCHAGRLREFALSNRETGVARGFQHENTDRVAFGYILNLDALREAGVVLQEGEC